MPITSTDQNTEIIDIFESQIYLIYSYNNYFDYYINIV